MPEDLRYEAALAAGMAILGQLAGKPGLEYPAQLSIVTYAILDAMDRLESGAARMPLPPAAGCSRPELIGHGRPFPACSQSRKGRLQ
jgi:hypothetical protein